MKIIAVALAMMIGGLATAKAQFSEEAIQAAIDLGYRDKLGDIVPSCIASPGLGRTFRGALNAGLTGGGARIETYSVSGMSPLARAADIAREHANKHMPPPQPTDVSVTVGRDVFTVHISPQAGTMSGAANLAAEPVKHVVLRPHGAKNGRGTIQPLEVAQANSVTYQNLFGARFEATGAVALFDSGAVLQVARRKDVEVVIVTSDGEMKCKLDDKRIRRGYNPVDR